MIIIISIKYASMYNLFFMIIITAYTSFLFSLRRPARAEFLEALLLLSLLMIIKVFFVWYDNIGSQRGQYISCKFTMLTLSLFAFH